MKQLIIPSAIISVLIVFFIVVDRQEFIRQDDVQAVQCETKPVKVKTATKNKKMVTETNIIETNLAETKLSTEKKPIEHNAIEETASTETKYVINISATPQIVTEKKSEGKLMPAAIPLVSDKTAKILNDAAIEYAKSFLNRYSFIKKGYKHMIHDEFRNKGFTIVRSNLKTETSSNETANNLKDFNTRLIPNGWAINDVDNLPTSVLFKKTNDGFFVDTGKKNIRFLTPSLNNMRSSFFVEMVIKNESQEDECEIELGVQGSGIVRNGYNSKRKQVLMPEQETILQWEISVYDRYYKMRPSISVNGNALLKEYNVYRLDHNEITLVEGEIIARSSLPDPQNTDYPDCRYTAHFVGNSIISGSPCNKELVLSIDGFLDKKVLSSNKLKEKDKIQCAIVRFDSVPEELSETQEADTLSLFELDSYLLLSYQTIESFSDFSKTNPDIPFKDDTSEKKEYVSIFKRHINPPLADEEKKAQQASIARDLDKIEKMLLAYSDDNKQEVNIAFNSAWNKEKAKDQSGMNRIGRYVWRNMNNSFYVLPESYSIINNDYPKISEHNLEAIVALKDYLESQGVQLIISLVPDYYDISARVMNQDFSSLPDFRTASAVKQLLENGVETIYASDAIIANYNKYEIPFFYPNDPHPGDLPQDVLSDLVAERLSRFNFPRQMDRDDFQMFQEVDFSFIRPFPEKCDIGKHQPGDFYLINRIRYRNQGISNDTNSPILVLGNSYSITPEPISNYLCMKMGINIYHYKVLGNLVFSTAIQRLFNNPEFFLKNRKVLVLSVGTIHIAADITIPNIRDLDSDAEHFSNLKLLNTMDLQGNNTTIPSFAQQLPNPSIFITDEDGICPILDDSNSIISTLDPSKDSFIVLYYCFAASATFELIANDVSYPLVGSGSDHSSVFFKQVIPVHHSENGFSIRIVGKPNTAFAIGKVQVYQ